MPKFQEPDDEPPSVHEYTEASASLNTSSEGETDPEELGSLAAKGGVVLSAPRRAALRNARGNLSRSLPRSRDCHHEEQETTLKRALRDLESAEEVRRSYPPRFSTIGPSEVAPSYSPESQISSDFIDLDRGQTNEDNEDDFGLKDSAFFFEFELEDFCVYQSSTTCSGAKERDGLEGRYESLHIVTSCRDDTDWFIDGTIKSAENRRSFIRGAIVDVSIGALEDQTQHSAAEFIWVLTTEGQKRHYWYKLRTPSKAYERYWSSYLWLADFTKYFIDFLHVNLATGVSVCLRAFESSFWTWVKEVHGSKVSDWHRQCGERKDFRQYVLYYAQFLRERVCHLQEKGDGDNPRLSHPVWDEIAAGEISYDRETISSREKTVVTRHVASSFLKPFPGWRDQHRLLNVVEKCAEVEAYADDKRRKWNFPNKLGFSQRDNFKGTGRHKISIAAGLLEEAAIENSPVHVRDPSLLLRAVVIIRDPLTDWDEYNFRYAWVRAVSNTTLSVVWLVLPTDTLCGNSEDKTFYPIGNELFFSDDCNCKPISVRNVIKIVKATPFSDHAQEGSQLFIHSLYRQNGGIHVKAIESELSCHCQKTRGASARRTKKLAREHPADPSTAHKMKVCALCSGAGLLDHAFCNAGLAETVLAVEHNEMAARSHMANNRSDQCEYLIDSVNPVLQDYMTGTKPLPSQIHCIIAGCPCQGFSVLNHHKGASNYQSQKNCSILANMLSWIEVFMPAYVLIENVGNMDRLRPNSCRQAICHLVALGYQVRKSFRVDCEVGGVSTRERLFIVAAAPGATLPNEIPITHHRRDRPGSEYKPRSAWSAICDLKPIDNDTVLNHEDPDHIPLKRLKINWDKDVSFRNLVPKIDTSLSEAYYSSKLSRTENRFFRGLNPTQRERSSKVLMRIKKDEPFRTITTGINPFEARTGGEVVHPSQDRLISLRETCRAMGVPDGFLLAGTIVQKHKQLGNGVPGALAHGWGVEFGKAWLETLQQGAGGDESGADKAPFSSVKAAQDTCYPENISTPASTSTTTRDGALEQTTRSTFNLAYSTVDTVARTRRARRVIEDSENEEEEQGGSQHMSRVDITSRSSLITTTERPRLGRSRQGQPFKPNETIVISSDEEEYWSALDDSKTSLSPLPRKHCVKSPTKLPFERTPRDQEPGTKPARAAQPCPVPVPVPDPARSSRTQRTSEFRKKREAPMGPGDENDGRENCDDSDHVYLETSQAKKARV
ncbi:hypothetical protein G647_04183 [Cladophialophora carrionii CBS 160.54]|uniref:DNA (cytosine-5-)-methyltransferase n=1 Tax=Cladophialophora carrionii CBS 160.54 TaxID=1279043 RepID=V9DEP7_9EURO|nr:uncharacterized protein G647_04183 [Cladophialophora carrionii CBS 160.54]ETI24813.1 hypothetical protein G647_04183 [Cladophialophora carrionii CBS 160.54]